MSNLPGFLFPGQGSQYVGMGKDFYDAGGFAKDCYDRACEILGVDIRRICFEGPEEELRQTANTQPAIYLHSVVATARLESRGIRPSVVAGHSVGEFAALFAAGVYDFETGLRILARRARYMEEDGRERPGTMAAILNLDLVEVQAACDESSTEEEPVGIGLYNAEGQLVLSGAKDAVLRAMEACKRRGARRAVELKVSGAFHSPLLSNAREKLTRDLKRFEFERPACFFVSNYLGQTVEDTDMIKMHLADLLVSPVRWTSCMGHMLYLGVTEFIEAGPGNVLQGLLKKASPDTICRPAGTVQEVDQLEVGARA